MESKAENLGVIFNIVEMSHSECVKCLYLPVPVFFFRRFIKIMSIS